MALCCCWWCCHPIPTDVPVLHMPYALKNDQFLTKGQFCSWECMKTYNVRNESYTSCRIADLITLYRKRVYGHIESVAMAPDRYTLEAFGGPLSIEEFRSGLTRAWLALPNEVYTKQQVFQKPVDGELVLKRNKPLRRDKNSIKNALGITLKK